MGLPVKFNHLQKGSAMKGLCCVFVLLLTCLCAAQHKFQIKDNEVEMCWVDDNPLKDKYLVYYKDYSNLVDTSKWVIAGTTTDTKFTAIRGALKKVVYGISVVYDGDTSDVHSSLDTAACLNTTNCNTACVSQGGWYIDWSLKTPRLIRIVTK